MEKSWGLHWFRRDLRIAGNPGLRSQWQHLQNSKQGPSQDPVRVLGLFCFDSQFLGRADFSANRFAFFLKTLQELRTEMRGLGGDLLVVDAQPEKAFAQLIHFFDQQRLPRPELITWCRDYEPFARQRDQKVHALLTKLGVPCTDHRDHLLLEPQEILKDNQEFYQVYTPFSRKWLAALETPAIQQRLSSVRSRKKPSTKIFGINWEKWQNLSAFPYRDELTSFIEKNQCNVTVPIPSVGSAQALQQWQDFSLRLDNYKVDRDIPSLAGTSQLSLYLKNGSLVSSQILAAMVNKPEGKDKSAGFTIPRHPSRLQFLKELAWREFYYAILWHRPDVEKQSFLPQYINLPWPNNHDWFQRWQEGTTGFPIVDAGMRQLLHSGWMHNRVRMIVASFLCKDLLIDWRWGENHFMKYLLDGDLAPNNGGWQWAASTGCDPQPYFRIFNPWLQAKKFDPQGLYIKQWVPELRAVSIADLHNPLGDRGVAHYPQPIVQHEMQRAEALRLYQSMK